MNKKQIENLLTSALDDRTFESILEMFDLTPQEVFVFLYDNGLIDDDILESEFEIYEKLQ